MKKALLIVGGGVLLVMLISANSASSTTPIFPVKCLEKSEQNDIDKGGCLEKQLTNNTKTSELFLRELKKRERRVLA